LKEFTAKQQEVWDLTRPLGEGGQGKTRAEAAAILGISASVVSKTLQACYRKRGIVKNQGWQPSLGVEMKDPEKAAAVLDAASEPAALTSIREAIRAAGLPERAGEALLRRLRSKFFGVITECRNLKTNEILELLGQRIHLGLQYLDDKAFAEASARDIMIGLAGLMEKRQLLRGEPTQIVSEVERKKMHELTPLLIQEAQRRGLTIEGEAKRVEDVRLPA
jgi:hypothetical protein